MPKLLALLSNPDNTVKLRMDREMKKLKSRIAPGAGHNFTCKEVYCITIAELPGLITTEKPDMLHFSGHGRQESLSFEDTRGQSHRVSADALDRIFKQSGKYVNFLFMNACHSAAMAERFSAYIPFVIGYPNEVPDNVAELFSESLYEHLSHGNSVIDAFDIAYAVALSFAVHNELPILYTNENLPGYNRSLFTQPELNARFVLNTEGFPKEKSYGYKIEIDMVNIPSTASYIIYEFVDDEIDEKDRFVLINNPKSGSIAEDYWYGNVIVRAWIWMDASKTGIGFEKSLVHCLETGYKDKIPENCQEAFEYISVH